MTTGDGHHKILIADDDGASSRLAEANLAASGFEVAVVGDGRAAIEAFRRSEPDLLLLDLLMPGLDGYAVARAVRGEEAGRHTPIVVMTSLEDQDAVDQAFAAGVSAFSVKPLNWAIEIHRFRYLIRNADVQRRLHRRMVELQHAQKQDAIGRLAGGIAHDFNNMLTAIINGSELALLNLSQPDDARRELAEIRKAAERAVALTRQLLAFSLRQPLQPRVLDVNALIGGMSRMLERMLADSVELKFSLAPHLAPVKVDAGQLEQVVMNLAVNANDAMPEGGALTISTHAAPRSKEVILSIRDSGHGMTREIQQRIFEPFFTTKRLGHGTGLGLSTVFGVVRQSGGRVEVESRVGQGACFHVVLPASDQPLTDEPATEAAGVAEGTETILLVEDEDSLRDVFAKRLRSCGYTVLEAADGRQALVLAAAYRGHVDLLLTDLVMPKLNGRRLADALCARQPGIKVLYMTGYTEHRLLDEELTRDETRLLQKPFPLTALHPAVRRLLDEPGTAGRMPADRPAGSTQRPCSPRRPENPAPSQTR